MGAMILPFRRPERRRLTLDDIDRVDALGMCATCDELDWCQRTPADGLCERHARLARRGED